jgi:hypothetical protein
MAKKDLPSAVPPTLFSAEIPGSLVVRNALATAANVERPPASDYARGSDQDRNR